MKQTKKLQFNYKSIKLCCKDRRSVIRKEENPCWLKFYERD